MKSSVLLVVVSALVGASCVGAEKSANPLSPAVAGPIPGINITSPNPLDPRDGVRIAVAQQPVTLVLENAASNGERPLSYVFDVSTDLGFTNKVFTREGVTPGDGGRTTLRLPDPLASGRTYYWRAQAKDGANTGPISPTAFFTIYTPIVIGKPRSDSPINNVRLDDLRPEFKVTNAARSGPVGAMGYVLEIADSDSFANKIAVWSFGEQPNQTKFEAPHTLVADKQFFWHVQAYDTSSNTTGPWSDTEVFRTAAPVILVPTPPQGGGGGSCGPPFPNQPFGIVQCRRSQFGHMSSSQTVTFLKAVARDLNAAGIAGGPFGILTKTTGNNCEGYSCDFICNPRGEGWDVLIDGEGSQDPTWGGPKDYPSNRTCKIQ